MLTKVLSNPSRVVPMLYKLEVFLGHLNGEGRRDTQSLDIRGVHEVHARNGVPVRATRVPCDDVRGQAAEEGLPLAGRVSGAKPGGEVVGA